MQTYTHTHTHKQIKKLNFNTYPFIASVQSKFNSTLKCTAKLMYYFLLLAIHFDCLMCSSQTLQFLFRCSLTALGLSPEHGLLNQVCNKEH